MAKTIPVLVMLLTLTSCLHDGRGNASLDEQWNAVESRYPKIASAYRVQQAALANSAAAIAKLKSCTTPCVMSVSPSFCDMVDSGLIYVTLRAYQKVCGLPDGFTEAPVPNVGGCWTKFERCEGADVPADCDGDLASCLKPQ